jgi:hypothetical protein
MLGVAPAELPDLLRRRALFETGKIAGASG